MKTLAITFALLASSAHALDYAVGFLACPLDASVTNFEPQSFSQGFGPFVHHAGTNLMIREADGTERVLVQGQQGELVAVHDWCVSLDGKSVYYSHVFEHDRRTHADLFRIPVEGGKAERLTDAVNEWRPPSGVFPKGSKGSVWNVAPCDTPEGIVFTSTRDGIQSPHESYAAGMLYTMSHDGSNVAKIGHMNLGGALHPSYFRGRIYFASGEQQGARLGRGSGWAIWSIKFDGTDWQPELTPIPLLGTRSIGWHVSTHSSDGTLLADLYYDSRAIGSIHAVPVQEASPFAPPSHFGHPVPSQNPFVWDGWDAKDERVRTGNYRRWSFQRRGLFNLLPWSMVHDRLNTVGDADSYHQREAGHPSGAPGNAVLVTWTGDKPTHRDFGVYVVPDASVKHYPPPDGPLPSEMPLDYFAKVADEPDRHEWYPRAIASYEQVFGHPAPAMQASPVAELPPGSPYALVGSNNVLTPEVVSSDGKTLLQFDAKDFAAIRILAFNPTQNGLEVGQRVRNGAINNREGFHSAINERTGFYSQTVPIEADGSFLAALPADQPWTFQVLDGDGSALFTAQTWHQLRPSEKRADCRGCHSHWKPVQTPFEETIAGKPGYAFRKLDKITTVEYERDVRSIDERLGLGIGPRPWESGPKPYESRTWPVVKDERLTGEESRLLRAWADTGFMAAGKLLDGKPITPESGHGPYADCVPPTLNLVTHADLTLIGACDPQSGLNVESLSVVSGGKEIADQFTRAGDVWIGPPVKGVVTVSVRDNQHATGAEAGNVTKIVRTVSDEPPEPEPPKTLEQRVDDLERRVKSLESR